jgi:hypothetical protein
MEEDVNLLFIQDLFPRIFRGKIESNPAPLD